MCDDIKSMLRREIKCMRRNINSDLKRSMDNKIYHNILKLNLLENADIILVYMSTDIEVDTEKIIKYCINTSKKIALPRCIENHKMNFYYYNNDTVMEKSHYGIYEPYPDEDNFVGSFENAVCLVPGLAFDNKGYRLGYGGGYYDRFLSEHKNIVTIGLCYQENIKKELIRNKYDIHVNYVVTEKSMEVCNG